MAKINTKLTLDAPDEISIPLIRADQMEMSNTFRLFFEVFLAISATLAGVALSSQNVEKIHWFFLAVTTISALIFLYKSHSVKKPIS